MAEPPRDANGNVIPYDDADIGNDDGLIRHINPNYHVVLDKNTGRKRLSTAAFSESSKPPGGMSVDLERPLTEAGLDYLAMLPDTDFGAVRLIAGEMRELGHKVGRNPLPQNPYHGEVWDIGRGRAAKKRIMEKSVWLKKPLGLG
jgi:hypothetical protein